MTESPMKAIDFEALDSFDLKARAICTERGWTSAEDLARVSHGLRFHAYQEAIRPFVKIRADLLTMKMPKYTRHADGRVEIEYEWTEEEKKINAKVDELIHAEAARVGLATDRVSAGESK